MGDRDRSRQGKNRRSTEVRQGREMEEGAAGQENSPVSSGNKSLPVRETKPCRGEALGGNSKARERSVKQVTRQEAIED